MTESILSSVASEIIVRLGSSIVKQFGLCWGLNDELAKFKITVATVEAVLLHAEEQSIDNPQVRNWLGMLREAFYDAEDLLDEFSYEELRQQVMGASGFTKKVRLFFSSSNEFAFGFKMGHKVKALRERLDEIAAEKNKFHLEERFVVSRPVVPVERYQTHSSPPQVVIGREHDREEMIRLLLSSDCDENVSVVSIVGIGGLGKTTLAQMVYNDDRVKKNFELKIWVCVSNDFDVKSLVKRVLESLTRESPKTSEMENLKNLLLEKITGRKFLFVLDDVWNEDANKWSSFKDLLAGGARGSKIIVTTRSRKVAEKSRSIFIHELSGLSDDEAWSLFEKLAFKQGHLPNPNHEAIGREILKKCCGVPLAIRAIGGVVFFKDPNFEWVSFKDNELLKLDVFNRDISPILRLSYDHLPSHYKRCFAYCSLYPKDFSLCVNELINLWNAQGYLINSTNPNECLRDVGFECFMRLFRSSFFQDVRKDDFGNIVHCKMHDLMHDLAVSVSRDSGKMHTENNTRHLSFGKYSFPDVSSFLNSKKIRTILQLPEMYFMSIDKEAVSLIGNTKIDALLCSSQCLRVLSLPYWRISTLPSSVSKLKHLRYLDLSRSSFEKLPDSITKLHSLQVLLLKWCKHLTQLPRDVKKLVNLTDLDNEGCDKLSHMPRGIGQLKHLEKLSKFVIAKDVCEHVGGLDELYALNKLRGELKIKNLRYAKNGPSEFTGACLSVKHKLQGMALDWGWYEDNDNDHWSANDVENEEMGMEALRPHQNLKALAVRSYRGVKPPSWLPSLINLVQLSFRYCKKLEWLPYLKNGGGSSMFFPFLTNLVLEDCRNLRGFERQSAEELLCFPRLSHLEISGSPNLTYLPLFPELETFESREDGIESFIRVLKTRTNSASQLQHLCVRDRKNSLENEFLLYLPTLQSIKFMNSSFSTVFSDEKDDVMHWQSLKVLHTVAFTSLGNLVALPNGLQYVTTLRCLEIYFCPGLAYIPEWMPKLATLQDFSICFSPQLEQRCQDKYAEDWAKISHIPNIYIDWEPIQKNGCYLL